MKKPDVKDQSVTIFVMPTEKANVLLSFLEVSYQQAFFSAAICGGGMPTDTAAVAALLDAAATWRAGVKARQESSEKAKPTKKASRR